MTEPSADRDLPVVEWESFYRDYRKPGYIDGFEITSKLGGGMFGLVFKARKQSIGKDYAIKFLKVDDAEVRRVVLAELDAVSHFAQVDHPNLVSIEDRGTVDGIPYIVMAYAGDATLRDRLAADDAGRDSLLRLFLQACRGVQALHHHSLVHFDLKPANIFIKGEVARVGDYGLSKLVAQSRNSLSMGRGTPYYMAPEMLQRKGDARSDIYSLGVILYECLTGTLPFRGDSEWEVLRKHETATPEYPVDLDPAHRAVLERCLQKDPTARYESVGEMIQDLTGVSAHGPAPAGESSEASAEDPYAGLRDAARGFSEHAAGMATEAAKIAREATERGLNEARRAARSSHRLRAARRHWAHQQKSWRGAWDNRRARRLSRRNRFGWWPALVAFVVVMMVLMATFMGVQRVAVAPSAAVAVQSVRSPSPAPARPVAEAGLELQLRMAAFANRLPRTPTELERRAADYRTITVEWGDASGRSQRQIRRLSERVAASAATDSSASDALRVHGYSGVLAAIAALQAEDFSSARSLQRATRLNQYLQSTLGFRGITISDSDTPRFTREQQQVFNHHAPQLWMAFIEEFAPNSKSFEQLRGEQGSSQQQHR